MNYKRQQLANCNLTEKKEILHILSKSKYVFQERRRREKEAQDAVKAAKSLAGGEKPPSEVHSGPPSALDIDAFLTGQGIATRDKVKIIKKNESLD